MALKSVWKMARSGWSQLGRRGRYAAIAGIASAIVGITLLIAFSGDDDEHSGGDDGASASGAATTRALQASTRPAIGVFQTTDTQMEAYFVSAAAPASRPAALDPQILVGTWNGRFVSVDLPDSAPIDAESLDPFSFTISRSGDGYALANSAGKGEPRRIELREDGALAARGAEAADVVLTMRDDVLIGSTLIERPVRGRIEFHATRIR